MEELATAEWTLRELVERASQALAAADVQVSNARVTPMPDARVIRWYATIGLVDRPVAMRGRTAIYGPRHLLQLVAVKRRQAQGRTLAEIQAELAGATDAMLRRIAELPDDAALRRIAELPEDADLPDDATRPDSSGHPVVRLNDKAMPFHDGTPPTGAFRPGRTGPTRPSGAAPGSPLKTPPENGSPWSRRRFWTQAPTVSEVLSGVRLAGGAVLLLPAIPESADLAEIASAARPLLDLLAARGLLRDPANQTDEAHPDEAHPTDDDH